MTPGVSESRVSECHQPRLMSAHIGRQMSDGNQDVTQSEREREREREEKTHGSYFLISVPKDPLCA